MTGKRRARIAAGDIGAGLIGREVFKRSREPEIAGGVVLITAL